VRAAVSSADQAASSLAIKAGLQKLTLQSAAGLISADTNFAVALQKNPTNSQALILKTGTELFILQQSPQFITLLTQIGVMQPNGSIYGYDYQLPIDMNGNPIVATTSRTEQILFYATNTLRPAIDRAIGRLEMVSTNVSFTLTADQTSTEPAAVDYGDVKGVLTLLYLTKSAIHGLNSYNLGVALPDFVKLMQEASTVQDILKAYPSLFSSNPNVAQRALAKDAFSKANSSYQVASGYIRNQRVERRGFRNLISFDTSSKEALTAEQVTRNRFAALATSLSTPAVFPADANSPSLLDGKTISLGQFFQTTTSPRGWLTTNNFYGNFYTPGTVTDPSLSGIFPGQTHANLNSLFLDYHRLNTYTPWKVTTIAGKNGKTGHVNGIASNAKFIAPKGIAIDPLGNIFVSETSDWNPTNGSQIVGNVIRKISTNGTVSTIAGKVGMEYWNSTYQNGWYAPLPLEGKGTNIVLISPNALAIARDGKTLFIADGNYIRKLDESNNISIYAGNTNELSRGLDGFRTEATFRWIESIAIDKQGNLFIADSARVRKISTNGYVSTIAGAIWVDEHEDGIEISFLEGYADGKGTNALFSYISAITVDLAGNIFVADQGNNVIRRISQQGIVSTYAGQSQTFGWRDNYRTTNSLRNVSFASLDGLSSDASGNLIVLDGNVVRMITTNGVISTLAGNFNNSGDFSKDGDGQYGCFRSGMGGVAIAQNGAIYVSDTRSSIIRKLTSPTTTSRAQTITFTQPAAQTFVPNRTFALSATAPGGAVAFTSGNTNVISIVGNTATIRGVGTVVITANQGGNANFAAAPAVTRSVTVNKGSQTITFTPPATNTFVMNGTLSFPTTASSGLTIAYTSSNTNILTVSRAIATMKAKGTVNVTASQSGNTNFNAATPVIRTITLR
jgi:sugar lactone lactonase YvrE